jgi:hypothetical protein
VGPWTQSPAGEYRLYESALLTQRSSAHKVPQLCRQENTGRARKAGPGTHSSAKVKTYRVWLRADVPVRSVRVDEHVRVMHRWQLSKPWYIGWPRSPTSPLRRSA